MSISYLSQPYESRVQAYQENVPLIAQVANQKQSKYDNLLTTIFQKQNQLLNLDTLNEKVTKQKNDLLKYADEELSKLAASDLTIPENIQKVENLFTPITSNSGIMSDIYYTKQIRENQEFAQQALKKDPSIGNQTNYNTSQRLVDLYRKADIDQLGEASKYATLFTPYVDIKGKKMDFLQKLGVIKDGYTDEVEIITEDGIKYYRKGEGRIPEAEVLAKFNASLTPEDRQQLLLDGYHDYGNADLNKFIPALAESQSIQVKDVSTKIGLIDERIKVLDANGDGKVDKQDVNSGTNQQILNSYLSQKDYYLQKRQMLDSRGKYLEKYQTNGDLVLEDRMNLFAGLKQDEFVNDMVTLLSQSEPLKQSFKWDATLAFNRDTKLMEEEIKAKAEKAKKDAENGITQNTDYNNDGIIDYQTGADTYISRTKITSEQLQEESETGVVKTPTFGVIPGTKTPSTKDISAFNIKNYKTLFDNIYQGKAVNAKEVATQMLSKMAVGTDGNIDETKLKEIQAQYDVYKRGIEVGKKTEAQIEEDIKKDASLKKFEDLRQLETNLNKAGNINVIHDQVRTYIKDKWDKEIKDLARNPVSVDELTKLGNNKIQEAVEHTVDNYTGIPAQNILNPIKDLIITPNDDHLTISQKIADAYKSKNLQPVGAIVSKMASAIIEAKTAWGTNTLGRRETEIQDIYKQLIDKDSFIELTVSPPIADGKKDPFYMKLNAALNKGIQDNKVKFKNLEGKEIPLSEVKKFENSFGTLTYNTGTGTIKGSMGLEGVFEYQLTPEEGKNNGLPFGLPSDDLIGKQLFLQTHLDVLKNGSSATKISRQIPIGKIPNLGQASIYYDGNDQVFKVGYFSETEKQFKNVSDIQGTNTRQTTMKFLQYLQSLGADPSSFNTSSLNMLQ